MSLFYGLLRKKEENFKKEGILSKMYTRDAYSNTRGKLRSRYCIS